ncbi:type I-E CRISPR-associated protein Cas5/CasD [Streptomyces rubiginosohelvolus]|uniref:type I-E CRISPR-associated protein Cas5/CasD n=1 Tax=Streptomyces rubiginosohelvolus TaxID=67362 RepID=UPI0035E222C3
MSGLLLRLAGPLQSWGERSAFTPVRETAPFPTRSALVGMFAAAEGIARGDTAGLKKYAQVRLTVRIDRPGTLLEDYHTVGGGFPKERTAATSGGSNKDAAVITRRQYLSDAVFVVAVTAPDDLTTQLGAALRRPYWAPYLGRRSCPPDEPFLLRQHVDDPENELLTGVPLAAPEPRDTAVETLKVQFLRERPLAQGGPGAAADVIEVNDMPVSFAPHGRAHTGRRLYRTVEPVSRALAGPQKTLLTRLIDYTHAEEHA